VEAARARTQRASSAFLSGTWDTSGGTGVDVGKAVHPAGFPVVLPEIAIGVYTNMHDRVLDPFLGTGTTLVAAQRTGRVGYGIEISPAFVDVTCRRFQRYTGIRPVHAATGQHVDFSAEAVA
jgi:DNA modification methylase